MRLIIFILLFGFNLSVFAQECFPLSNKERRISKKARKYISDGKLYAAADLLEGEDDLPFYLALEAEILWLRNNELFAEMKALNVVSLCPNSFPETYYLLGQIYFKRKDYISAVKFLERSFDLASLTGYYSNVVLLLEKAKILANIISSPVLFNPTIVNGVSTEYDEYLPIISPDQEFSFFTRRSLKKDIDFLVPSFVEEFIISKKDNGQFSKGSLMPYPFNQESNEGGASITIDNQVLYFTKCVRNKKGYNNCDIYYVKRRGDGWSEVQKFNNNISRDSSWESQPTVSSDGKTIIFASDRVGGFGKIDLYEINYIDGKWKGPKNLGPSINSNMNEKSPFLHADSQTLFFSSDNFPSLGGFDIFFSRKDSVGNWTAPINIGYPINSISDEISLFVSTDGNKAFFASNQLNGIGGWDVYSFDLYDKARPERVLFLKGNLLGENGEVLEGIELEIKNIKTKEVTIVKVDSGSYVSSLTLARDEDVLISVKKEGFAFNSEYISANDTFFYSPTTLNFEVKKLEEGRSFEIQNIYFDNNSFDIKEMSKEVLKEFSDYLSLNNKLVIEINGFTDFIGGVLENQILSENRAKAVYDMIVSSGISKDRLSFNGFGEQFPIASNASEKGRAKNRRTEFKIISK